MHTFYIKQPDGNLRPALQDKIDNLNKPKGSMGLLEDLALQIGLIQHTLSPSLKNPCHLLLGGDHGIVAEGVSATPKEVTWQQMLNFTHGGGGVNLFCRQHHFHLRIVDMGVDHDLSSVPGILNDKIDYGTKNFLYGPAMTERQFDDAIEKGVQLVNACYSEGCNVISLGEMGVGNTSASSIWMSLFCNLPLAECVGSGSGLDSEKVKHKYKVLQQAVDRYLSHHDECGKERTISILRYFGGFEMIGAIGAMLRAAELHMIILIDGFIMTACLLGASQLEPDIRPYAIFGHCGDEEGHRKMLDFLHARPILSLGLRLGEGTGALCAYPIVDSAVRMLNEMNTFQKGHITKYFS